jgi:hypothetical protein
MRSETLLTSVVQVGFYKSFGRPVAKVFLGAICVYQAAYWGWKKLEVDEMKREKTGKLPVAGAAQPGTQGVDAGQQRLARCRASSMGSEDGRASA